METKIHLNILGLKNFDSEKLKELLKEVETLYLQVRYGTPLYEPLEKLKVKIRYEIGKRERRKWVWLEFTSYWSGYTSSQSKLVGKHYRKVDKATADKMPKWFSHSFTDNTTNDWSIKQVDVPGKSEGSYSNQIDEFLRTV
jgi:hypothetical protein